MTEPRRHFADAARRTFRTGRARAAGRLTGRAGLLAWAFLLLSLITLSASASASDAASAVPSPVSVPADAVSAATLPAAARDADGRSVVTIARLDTMVNPWDDFMIRETVGALREALPRYALRLITLADVEAPEQIRLTRPDFLFAPATFPALSGVEAARIATRRTRLAERSERSVGAAVVVRRSSGIRTIADLKGAWVVTGLPTALDGWLAVAREIRALGFSGEPERFPASVRFRNNPYPDALSALLTGAADAAVIPACLLETVRARGLVDASDLRVAGVRPGELACAHSTRLYPDLSLLALGTAPESVVRDMTIAALSLKDSPDHEWLTNVSHAGVDELMRDLETGPWAYLKDMSPAALLERHRGKILLALGVALLLLLNELRLQRLVRRRTRELSEAMASRERMAEEASSARLELAGFERRSIVGQMSGMIAHEINAPVGAIRTWAAVIRLKCPERVFAAGSEETARLLADALARIDREADRIAGIVARVRAYAKRDLEPHAACDLAAMVERAAKAFRAEERAGSRTPVELSLPDGAAPVLGHALELEILFLNLIRNAAAAIREAAAAGALNEPGVVTVSLERRGSADRSEQYDRSGRPASLIVRIGNPGRRLAAEALEALNRRAAGVAPRPEGGAAAPGQSPASGAGLDSRPHGSGLGLGLSICRGIADRHGASLVFEARESGGATAVVTIDRETDATSGTTAGATDSRVPAKSAAKQDEDTQGGLA